LTGEPKGWDWDSGFGISGLELRVETEGDADVARNGRVGQIALRVLGAGLKV
jgi:hypothetical protein